MNLTLKSRLTWNQPWFQINSFLSILETTLILKATWIIHRYWIISHTIQIIEPVSLVSCEEGVNTIISNDSLVASSARWKSVDWFSISMLYLLTEKSWCALICSFVKIVSLMRSYFINKSRFQAHVGWCWAEHLRGWLMWHLTDIPWAGRFPVNCELNTAKLTNQFIQTGLRTFDWQQLFTWLWWWLPLRLSKRQSPLPTVILRTTLTRMITPY